MDRRLKVLLDGAFLGQLRHERSDLELIYGESWLGSGGYPVSPHIPLSGAAGPDSVQRFLANLLPEGPFLEDLSRITGYSKFNIFGLIAAIGSDTAGALSFCRDTEQCPETTFREVAPTELAERIASRGEVPITLWDEKPRLSVAGVQDKLTVLIRPDGVMGFGEGELCSTHILKFGKSGAPAEQHLVVNEYLCMRLARSVGLPVAEVEFERIGEPVLKVSRFDRRWEEDRVARLHLIDGCQLLDLPPVYKYERAFGKGRDVAGYRPGASLPRLFDACREHGAVPAAALKGLMDWTLFQLIIGNSDAHGKNISFFVGKRGLQVAPAYDLVCLDMYGEYDRDLAMAVGDCFNPDDIAPYQIALMCEECGIPRKPAARSLEALCERTLRAVGALPLECPAFTGEERDFAEALLSRVEANAVRLRAFAQEIPRVAV